MQRFRLVPLALALSLGVAACDAGITPPGPPPQPSLDAQLRAVLGGWGVVPIGPMPTQNPAQVALGQALFFDKILSGNRDVACATCHQPALGLTDGRSLAVGTGAGPGRVLGTGRHFTPRGAPTLLNAGIGLPTLFWDARLAGQHGVFRINQALPLPPSLPTILDVQAFLPVLNRLEMRGDPGDRDALGNLNELASIGDDQPAAIWDALVDRLLANDEYKTMFNAAFPGIGRRTRFEDAARALAVFQMEAFTLTSSPFDRYLNRDDFALTSEQKRGGILFFGKGRCSTCHNGPFLGGQQTANVGAPQVGPGGSQMPGLDLGVSEWNPTQFSAFAFRVPPLRNVELTAPYFHSGAYRTLEAVVQHYNDVVVALRTYDPSQLAPDVAPFYRGDAATVTAVLASLNFQLRQPLQLTPGEIGDVVAFLRSLTDPSAKDLGTLIPTRVPSGLPVAP